MEAVIAVACPTHRRDMALLREGFIVELQEGCWLCRVQGDPGRTLVRDNARVYGRWQDARCALTWAQKYRPFRNAQIIPVRINKKCVPLPVGTRNNLE